MQYGGYKSSNPARVEFFDNKGRKGGDIKNW